MIVKLITQIQKYVCSITELTICYLQFADAVYPVMKTVCLISLFSHKKKQ